MNRNKGISLIILVITIVIIIILAAAVILTISKNNPVESAKKATFVSDLSSYQDELSLYIGNEYIKNDGNYDISSLDNKALEEVIEINSKYNNKFAIKTGRIVGTDKLTEQEKEWAESITGGSTGVVTPPVPSYPTKYTDIDGKTAYIPKDFEVSAVSTEQKIDTGLVVKDEKGNEFVWIPVEYTNEAEFNSKFIRKQGYYNGGVHNIFSNCSEPYASASQSESDEYKAMVESVKKYKGYYIGRFEASNDGNANAQSKPNILPWASIKWGNSMTDLTGGAVEKARAVYPVTTASTGSAVSTLIYGVQWSVALDYIENYGEKNTTYRKDSAGKGNYSKKVINTGSNVSYSLNNIYDMAGNVYEWTMETYSNAYRVSSGGGFYSDSGYSGPVSYRYCDNTTAIFDDIGFRIALYIK